MLGLPVWDPCLRGTLVSSHAKTNKEKRKQKQLHTLAFKFHKILIALLFALIVSLKIAEMIYDLLHPTGQDLQLPRGKEHKRTSRSYLKVPQLKDFPF